MKHQLFADYLERLEGLQRGLHKDVRDLPAEAMDWLPGPAMNSVAVLLAHIAGVLHEGIDIALDDPPSRVRAQEFQTRGVLSAAMLRRLDAVIDYARSARPAWAWRIWIKSERMRMRRSPAVGPCCMPWNTPTCTSAMYS